MFNKNWITRIALAGFVCLGVMASVADADTLYALKDSDDSLYTIDTDSLAVTRVGSVGVSTSFGGLAFDGITETLYMTGGRGNNNLYTVNTSTGAASLVGAHGQTDLFGLAFDSGSNTLYGSPFTGSRELVKLDTSTGAATVIGDMGRGIGGLAYDSQRDKLIGVQDGAGSLYEINRTTAATTLLGNGGFTNDSGLAYDSSKDLFWDADYSGNLFSFDPNNGFARTTEASGLGTFSGLAYGESVAPQTGLLFLMLPTNLDGDLDGESLLTLITLSGQPVGTIADTEWVIPDFGAISLAGTQLQNGVTPLTLFGGGNIIGASPHVYNDSPLPIDEDLQIAIVEGLLTIQNDPFAFTNYLLQQGMMPTDISQPGSAIEGLPPETLIGWFSTFDPNGGEDPTFESRLMNAIFDGTVNIMANSSSGEFEVFPHFDFGVISNIEIVFANDPTTFNQPMALVLDPQNITQVVLNPVPEPGSIVLMGLGLAVGAIVMRRRRQS